LNRALKKSAIKLVAIGARTMRHWSHLCRTLTLDNGKEFSQFKDLETQTGLSVFFADAYSSWQRGTNENTNGFTALLFSQGDKLQAHLSRGICQSRSTNQQQTEKMPWLPDTPGSLR
jgi:IS30 family transposase